MSALAVDILTAIYAAGGTVRVCRRRSLESERAGSAAQWADGFGSAPLSLTSPRCCPPYRLTGSPASQV